jgi:hypothetical protein
MKKVSTVAAKQSRSFSQSKLTIGLDLGHRSSWGFTRGFCSWADRGIEFLTPTIRSEPRLESANNLRERNGALQRVHAVVCAHRA